MDTSKVGEVLLLLCSMLNPCCALILESNVKVLAGVQAAMPPIQLPVSEPRRIAKDVPSGSTLMWGTEMEFLAPDHAMPIVAI